MITLNLVKIILPAVLSFGVGILITPFITGFLYRYKAWKKTPGKEGLDGNGATVFNSLHSKREVSVPRMGGVVIWVSSFVVIMALWMLAIIIPTETTQKLDFLSRDQTWIPLTGLMIGAVVGLLDDILEIAGSKKGFSKGLSLRYRLGIVGSIGLLCGWWFYSQLEVTSIGIPAGFEGATLGLLTIPEIGWLIIPLFAIVTMAIYSGGIIDGIDGLAGGIFATIFTAYAVLAFYLDQINLAAFCVMVAGSTLAFLWFNIPPARFYMSETGSMALTVTLAIVAFMTDDLAGGYGVLILPVIALPLVLTSLSVILQILSKKIRGKKLFRVAPLHHHFEAIGWPPYKVVMRFWIVGVVSALMGTILAVIGI